MHGLNTAWNLESKLLLSKEKRAILRIYMESPVRLNLKLPLQLRNFISYLYFLMEINVKLASSELFTVLKRTEEDFN